MLKVFRLCHLTQDEVRRIHQTLMKRYRRSPQNFVVEIAMGVAEKDGQLDRGRSDALIFYVLSKHTSHTPTDKIPAFEAVRIRRGRSYVLVELPTDVIEFRYDQLELTGRPISHASTPGRIATAGAVVVWRIDRKGPFHWCVTTAGHHFWDRPDVPERTPEVVIQCGNDRTLTGRLIMRSLPQEGVDIALVEVSQSELIDRQVIAPSGSTAAKRIRSIYEIRRDSLNRGTSHPESAGIEFDIIRYFYEFKLVPELGTLFDVLQVRSSENHAFGRGRSGALWVVARQAACHQSVGWRTDEPKKNFVEGAGQSLHYALRWVQAQLAKRYHTALDSVQVRLVATL